MCNLKKRATFVHPKYPIVFLTSYFKKSITPLIIIK